MTDKDRYELKIAGLLHDCGKVTTGACGRQGAKMQTISIALHLIDTRFEYSSAMPEIDH